MYQQHESMSSQRSECHPSSLDNRASFEYIGKPLTKKQTNESVSTLNKRSTLTHQDKLLLSNLGETNSSRLGTHKSMHNHRQHHGSQPVTDEQARLNQQIGQISDKNSDTFNLMNANGNQNMFSAHTQGHRQHSCSIYSLTSQSVGNEEEKADPSVTKVHSHALFTSHQVIENTQLNELQKKF